MIQIADKSKKEMEAKLAIVFDQETNGLSIELREILYDDMVTAFGNRLTVLNNVNVERIKVGNGQTIDTLISEEELLFTKCLRKERPISIPRIERLN